MDPDAIKFTIREHGTAARQMLALPGYALVLSNMADFHQDAMAATPLGDPGRAEREQHHTQLHAIREFHTTLTSYAAALDELEADEASDNQDT